MHGRGGVILLNQAPDLGSYARHSDPAYDAEPVAKPAHNGDACASLNPNRLNNRAVGCAALRPSHPSLKTGLESSLVQ